MRRSHPSLALLAVVGLLALASCGGDGEEGSEDAVQPATSPAKAIAAQVPTWTAPGARPAAGTFVGATDGPQGNPYVALVIQGDRLVAYLCDGKRVAEWFGARVENGQFRVRSAEGTRLEGKLGEGKVTGTAALPGEEELAFTARPAVRGETGLFIGPSERGFDRRWIVLEDGIRGLDEGSGSFKNGVALDEGASGGGGTVSGGGGGGGGTGTEPEPQTDKPQPGEQPSQETFGKCAPGNKCGLLLGADPTTFLGLTAECVANGGTPVTQTVTPLQRGGGAITWTLVSCK